MLDLLLRSLEDDASQTKRFQLYYELQGTYTGFAPYGGRLTTDPIKRLIRLDLIRSGLGHRRMMIPMWRETPVLEAAYLHLKSCIVMAEV
jgi:hypothetical protein